MKRDDGHDFKTECDNRDCGGSCFICCCGYCKICGLFEGCLTTQCPGVQAYKEHADAVYEGREDFVDGAWRQSVSPHSPVSYGARTCS